MKLTRFMVVMLMTFGLVAGCAGEDDAAVNRAEGTLTPAELGTIGAAVAAEPERSNEVLAEHGLTEETFATEVRRISADPESSDEYARSFRNES